jgi:hypothetical protein
MVIAGGVATAAVVLAAWLPVGALLSQRAQLSAASTHLAQLASQRRALIAESKRNATPTALNQLGREKYQLVEPGQRLIQVLTPSGAPTAGSSSGPYPGDPGLAPPVAPGGTAVSTVNTGSTAARPTRAAAQPGFLGRVVATFEFWR